jgi:hypothetical protein
MARLLKQSEAKRLGLPGRTSLEPVSGEIGARVTFRIAEIASAKPGDTPRGPHLHDGFEECIYVLSGRGTTHDPQYRKRAAGPPVLLSGPGRDRPHHRIRTLLGA